MNSSDKTVLIQRDERFQHDGIWVFVDDLDVVRKIVSKYFEKIYDYDDEEMLENDVDEFIDALERMPMCAESEAALMDGSGNDGYLGECPDAWGHYS